MKPKLLFICSRNQWRSPTAEALFKNHPRYDARSAGTTDRARIKVTDCHIGWADLIFCMERKHAERLRNLFPGEIGDKPVIILRIPDDFKFMDPELVELLATNSPNTSHSDPRADLKWSSTVTPLVRPALFVF